MFGKCLLAGALLFSPVNYAENVGDTTTQDTNTDWENAQNTVIEWTTDSDNDGIPDKIEAILEEWKNTELVGGITIGAIATVVIGAGTVILFFVKVRKKFNKAIDTSDKAIEEQNKQNALILDQAKTQLETIKQENDSLRNEIDKLLVYLEENKKVTTDVTKVINDNSEYLKNIDNANSKMDILLKNQLEIACNTPDLVSKGIAKSLMKKAKELEEKSDDEGRKESVQAN